MSKIGEDVARGLLKDLYDFYGVLGTDEDEWKDTGRRLLQSIIDGRLTFDSGSSSIKIGLQVPIKLENGTTIDSLTCNEPTAGELELLQKYGEGQGMTKSILLISKMSGLQSGVVQRMVARDLQTVSAVAMLFF